MRTFIIPDIHGEYDKLISCLQQVNFDYNVDKLIQLGDVVDRGPDSYKVVEELLKIKNLVAIKGNHDFCFVEGLITGDYVLMNQGCKDTIQSYIKDSCVEQQLYLDNNFYPPKYLTTLEIIHLPKSHIKFFNDQLPYYIDENNNLFVHGGFNRHFEIDDINHNFEDVLLWDRDLIAQARSYESMKNKTHPFKMKGDFKEVFIGHTPVQYFEETDQPLKYANVNLLDTGCGKGGPLTIMNLETREIHQAF